MPDDAVLADTSTIAEALGVTQRLVRSWAERRPRGNGFPEPVTWVFTNVRRPLYDLDQVTHWRRTHERPPHRPTIKPLADRLWAKVDRSAGPEACWPWMPAPNENGYGKIRVGGQTRRAHRVAWELANERPPAGDVDHICHNQDTRCPGGSTCPHRRCCNPAHLEDTDHRTNVLRGRVPGPRAAVR